MDSIKTLYLPRNCYNNTRLIDALAKIVVNNGGVEVTTWSNRKEEVKIIDRTAYNKINDIQERIKSTTKILEESDEDATTTYYDIPKKEYFKKHLQELEKELQELEKVKDDSAKISNHAITFGAYLQFYFDGYIYYIQLDDNPFFDNYLMKEPCIINGDNYLTEYRRYLQKLNIDFYIDYCFEELADADIIELAQQLWNYLLKCNESAIVTQKRRVYDFNGGYHYEHEKQKRVEKYFER